MIGVADDANPGALKLEVTAEISDRLRASTLS
jgi:hypothetical protein